MILVRICQEERGGEDGVEGRHLAVGIPPQARVDTVEPVVCGVM